MMQAGNRGDVVRLKADLPETVFRPTRGYGLGSIPNTGVNALQNATWHTLEEIKTAQTLVYTPGHIFLGRVDDKMIGVRDNRHIVTIAGSRSGKSACLLIPNLLLYPGSALVIDPKGELAEASAVHRDKCLGHDVAVLDPFEIVKGAAAAYRATHDPLLEIDIESPDLIDDAAAVAEALVLESSGENGQHWTLAARNLLMGLVLFARIGGQSLSDIRRLLECDPASIWDTMKECAPQGNEPLELQAALDIIAGQGSTLSNKSDREAPAIISTAIEQLGFLKSPAMRQLFEDRKDRPRATLSTLKSNAQERQKTIYLVLPSGRVGTHSRWLRLMVTLALLHFERRSEIKPTHPVLMILEEFAALGHLRPVEQAAGFIAGSHVRLWSVLQDLSQLKTNYKEGWETFLGNAGILQAFSVSDLTTCEYLSKRIGETTVETTRKEEVGTSQFRGGDTGERREFRTVPLITPSEMGIEFARISVDGEARGGSALVLLEGARPFAVDRVFWGDLQ